MAFSVEVQQLIQYLLNTGVKHRVTAITGTYLGPGDPCSPHKPTSYHCKPGTAGTGLAIDVAEPTASHDSPGLLAIFASFAVVESNLAELIYASAPYNIKDGKRVPPYAVAEHHDHVHVAVNKGTFLLPVQGEPVMPDVKLIAAFPYQAGYVLVAEDGAIYCFGCEYKGGLKWDSVSKSWVLR